MAAVAIAVAIRLADVELTLLPGRGVFQNWSRRLAAQNVNRSQALVLVFFAVTLIALVVVRIFAPAVYSGALELPSGASYLLLNSFVVGVFAFVVLVSVGVVRRWRWMFWLLVIAFVAGILRLPALMLQVSGVLPSTSPMWYLVLQAVIGMMQFGIGLTLIRGYRRAGPWGSF